MKALEITLAALGGIVVGAAAALVVAPQSGKRTRCKIRKFIRENCPFVHEGQVEQMADELEDKLQETINATLATAKKK